MSVQQQLEHALALHQADKFAEAAAGYRKILRKQPAHLDALLKVFLVEDLGDVGDVTSDAMIPLARQATAVVRARGAGVLSGVPVMQRLVALAAPKVRLRVAMRDGQSFRAGDTIATLQGPLRGILKVERTLLNLLGRMSGVATATRRMVDGTRGTTARIRDTRKIDAVYNMTEQDVRHQARFDDSVGIYPEFIDGEAVEDNGHVSGGDSENESESNENPREWSASWSLDRPMSSRTPSTLSMETASSTSGRSQ
jgi:hypothetical protein